MLKHRALLAMGCIAALSLTCVLAGCTSGEEYVPASKDPVVTSPAIGADGVLKVGVDTASAPLAGTTSESKIVGIDVDIAAALADQLGLKVEIVDVGTDPSGALEKGDVDIVMGIDTTATVSGMWKTPEYLTTAVALFSKDASAPVPTKDDKADFAAQASSTSAWAATNEFGSKQVKLENDLEAVFKDLAEDKVKYAASDAIIGSYAAYADGQECSIIALLQQPTGYCIGVKDTNTDLQTQVDATLKNLSETGVISVISSKWLGASLDLSQVPLTAGAKGAKDDKKDSDSKKKDTKKSE